MLTVLTQTPPSVSGSRECQWRICFERPLAGLLKMANVYHFFSCLSGYPLNALPIIPTLRGVHHLRRKCPRENFQSTLEWGRAIQEEVSLVQTKAMKQMMGTTSSMRNRAIQKTLD
jgi:hypothetical protein